jgi:hypothetical protein
MPATSKLSIDLRTFVSGNTDLLTFVLSYAFHNLVQDRVIYYLNECRSSCFQALPSPNHSLRHYKNEFSKMVVVLILALSLGWSGSPPTWDLCELLQIIRLLSISSRLISHHSFYANCNSNHIIHTQFLKWSHSHSTVFVLFSNLPNTALFIDHYTQFWANMVKNKQTRNFKKKCIFQCMHSAAELI